MPVTEGLFSRLSGMGRPSPTDSPENLVAHSIVCCVAKGLPDCPCFVRMILCRSTLMFWSGLVLPPGGLLAVCIRVHPLKVSAVSVVTGQVNEGTRSSFV